MAIRDLENLIKASGNAGTSGQSFRNHVTGAASGVSMSSYIMTGWSWSGHPQTPEEFTYSSGSSFNMSATFSENSMAHNVRRQGAVLAPSDDGEGSMVVTTNSVTSSGATLNWSWTSRINPGAGTSGSGDLDLVNGPDNPGEFDYTVVATGGAGSGTETVSISIAYNPNVAGFWNDNLNEQFNVKFADRALTNSDIEVKWSDDGVNDNGETGRFYTVAQDNVGQDITVWYQWRKVGGSYNGTWLPIDGIDDRAES